MAEYTVDFIEERDYLHVTCSGKVEGIINMMTYSGAALQITLEKGFTKVLVDEREVSIILSDHDQHELMNFFLNDFPKSLNVKFSVVYAEKNKSVVYFFEDLSKRVGFDCTFYKTIEEGLKNIDID